MYYHNVKYLDGDPRDPNIDPNNITDGMDPNFQIAIKNMIQNMRSPESKFVTKIIGQGPNVGDSAGFGYHIKKRSENKFIVGGSPAQ